MPGFYRFRCPVVQCWVALGYRVALGYGVALGCFDWVAGLRWAMGLRWSALVEAVWLCKR